MRPRSIVSRAALHTALAIIAAGILACGSPAGSPTVPTPPSPPAAPPTSENRVPSVVVTFTGATSCKPHGSVSCTLDVTAAASDPDNDALTYAWSGCASGTSKTTVCTIKDPGIVAATVAVDDGHGHVVSASASAEGEREPNRQPSVTVVFPAGAICTPSVGAPCAVDVVAQAADPDGDALQYSWSGCASGTGERARCTVSAPGQVTATVTVDDRQTPSVHASGTATGAGTNRLPEVRVGHIMSPSGGHGEIDILGAVYDPDEGYLCGSQYCGAMSLSGACGSGILNCTCLADLEVRLLPTAATGACSVTIDVKDKWGAVGRSIITFDVGTLKILSQTTLSAVASQVPVASVR